MAHFAIDAPTLLHLVTSGLRANPAHQLVAPNLIRSHALTLILQSVQRAELTDAEALERHERITEVKMRLLGDRSSRRTHGSSHANTAGARSTEPNTSRSPNCRPTS